MTQGQQLAQMMGRSREYTMLYFNKLKDQDLQRPFVCEGVPLNTAYWVIAHLTASQNGLILMATGGEFKKFSWAKHFMPGAQQVPIADRPPFDEVLTLFHSIHAKSIAHVAGLTDEALQGPNLTGIAMIGHTVHDVVTHSIRHEALHAGHLSWLCKLCGVKTM